MLTPLTQTAISLLRNIANEEVPDLFQVVPPCSSSQFSALLSQLETNGLIQYKEGCPQELPSSYILCLPYKEITLLNILEATDEHLDCHKEINEEMYLRYRTTASKLGIVSHIVRRFLSEIKLADL